MDKQVIALGHIAANCYMLSDENTAIVIDPGKYSEAVEIFLSENSSKQRIILLTHAHFDHIGGAEILREKTGTQIAIGEFDAPALKDGVLNLSDMFHAKIVPFEADITLKNHETLTVGKVDINCIHTPGHTVGGMCFFIDGELFSGDTLFAESIGRTDFPGGSFEVISESIRYLYNSLSEDTVVYPGHGEATTIGYEMKNNPFVRNI